MNKILPSVKVLLRIAALWLLPALAGYTQSHYSVQHYTNENGLPANGVKGIELDRKTGFLWVGTQAGLVRFDGRHFKHFGSVKSTAGASRTTIIAKNREGTVYCEDDNFSLYRIEHTKPALVETDTFFMTPTSIRGGRYQIRPVNQVTERLRHHQPNSFLPNWMVFHDETGDSSNFSFIYFGHAYHYNAAEDTLFAFPGFEQLFKLSGEVYFVRANLEVWKFNNSLKKILPVNIPGMPAGNRKDSTNPRIIWTQGMKEPVLLYRQDIWKLQKEDSAIFLMPLCRECLPTNAEITSAQVWEEKGIIFLGSEINGLYAIQEPFLRTIRINPHIDAGKAEYAQIEFLPGIVVTASGLSFTTEGKAISNKTGLTFPASNVFTDHQGDNWFSASDTIIHYHRQGNYFTRIPVNDKAVKMVFAETRNRQYVISDIAIAEITNDQYRLLYSLPNSSHSLKNSLNPTEAIEWKPGIIAISAENLLLFNTETREAPDTVHIPHLAAKVRPLRKYGDYFLIGTYGQGFYMYRNGVVKKMPLDKNGYLSYPHCFMPDDKGYCWISTNHGLFKVSLHALMMAYENNLDEIYYHYFGKDNGIFNTEFNGGCQPCAIKLSSGLYSFPTMNGMVVFDPHRQHTPPPTGQLFMEEIQADGKMYKPGDHALQALPYHLRNLRFRITLPQFGSAENIYFSYKLEPYNEEWETQDILQNNTLQFGGLNPGSYKLLLRVRNGFGPDQFGTTVVEFRILKPWFLEWWFYVLCLLGFIALIWVLVKWRTLRIAGRKKELQQLVTLQTKNLETQSKQLERQLRQLQNQQEMLEEDNRIKARLIGMISHDMISPLKFMGFMSKKLKAIFPETDPSYKTASLINSVAQDLESLSVNMLNWIRLHHESLKMKPERFNLHELVEESVVIASTLAKEKGVVLYNEVPEDKEIFHYRQVMGVIIYNIAMNAMKYTEAGEIRITGEYSSRGCALSVSDTGKGMSPELVERLNTPESFSTGYSTGETTKYQFGYVIIKDLVRMVGGTLQVESTLNKGTRVTVQFSFQNLQAISSS